MPHQCPAHAGAALRASQRASGSPCRRSDRAGRSGAWGGFLATPCDPASPAPQQQHVGSPPPPGRLGQDYSFPAPRRTALAYLHTLNPVRPRTSQLCRGSLHGGTPESPKDRGARSSNSARPGSPHSAARARLWCAPLPSKSWNCEVSGHVCEHF